VLFLVVQANASAVELLRDEEEPFGHEQRACGFVTRAHYLAELSQEELDESVGEEVGRTTVDEKVFDAHHETLAHV